MEMTFDDFNGGRLTMAKSLIPKNSAVLAAINKGRQHKATRTGVAAGIGGAAGLLAARSRLLRAIGPKGVAALGMRPADESVNKLVSRVAKLGKIPLAGRYFKRRAAAMGASYAKQKALAEAEMAAKMESELPYLLRESHLGLPLAAAGALGAGAGYGLGKQHPKTSAALGGLAGIGGMAGLLATMRAGRASKMLPEVLKATKSARLRRILWKVLNER